MNIRETEIAIKLIKDFFERELAAALNLIRVSAPLFVLPETGLNDNLSGVERPVSFDIKNIGKNAEIVQSLAKWKRFALKRYGFMSNEGLYTDMNAIRRDDELDSIHSIYVDQWDWEKIINKDDRSMQTLHTCVRDIYGVFKKTEDYICGKYPQLKRFLSDDIFIVSSQELEDTYPEMTPKERENAICKDKGSVFITQIGAPLKSGIKHDFRAPDYDDWQLNGDLLFNYPVLGRAVELSSMGIRVDEDSMERQLAESGCTDRRELPFHRAVLNKELPYTIGGGLGQSRICMFFLNRAHIGEVHSSVWPEWMADEFSENGIELL